MFPERVQVIISIFPVLYKSRRYGSMIGFAEMLMILWSEMREDAETLSMISSSAHVITTSTE